ncbi:zonadhesin-like [Salvelinus namaycush]|uniref:Zonadhesin-like n=1 Tax=Salvelinus namaycush TaxID=8040 RepID=A0A8U0PYE0_SALNM|nr:zonadhesin-like [Salvelinus namaycush]
MDTCGCIYEGHYLMVGQVVLTKVCDSKCVCPASQAVWCEKLICARGEFSGLKDCQRMPMQAGALHGPPWYPLHLLQWHEAAVGIGAFEVASV